MNQAVPAIVGKYIRQLLAEHEEPARRGDGFPASKIRAAALLAILPLKASEVAEIVGTSGYVVRNWLAEPKFRELMERITREFAAFLLEADAAEFVPFVLNPAAEYAVEKTFERLEPRKDDEWLRRAHALVKTPKKAKTSKVKIGEWAYRRALHNTEFAKMEIATKGSYEDSLDQIERLLRARLHREIEKFLPTGEKGARARALLSELSGWAPPRQKSKISHGTKTA